MCNGVGKGSGRGNDMIKGNMKCNDDDTDNDHDYEFGTDKKKFGCYF